MPARPYVPSGLSESGAFPPILFGSVAAAVAAGLLESFVSQWFNLLIIFPAAVGLAAGGVATLFIGKKKVRAPLAAAVIAAFAGFVGQTSVHVGDYFRFRSVMTSEPDPMTSDEIDRALMEQTGAPGFSGYIRLAAEKGMTIKSTHGSSESTVSGSGSYALWGAEFLVAIGAAAALAFARAKAPFCEHCKQWYGEAKPVMLGSPDKKVLADVVRLLDAGDMKGAVHAMGEPTEKNLSRITLANCPACDIHEPLMTLQVFNRVKKNQKVVTSYRSLLRPDQAKALIEAANAQEKAQEKAPEA